MRGLDLLRRKSRRRFAKGRHGPMAQISRGDDEGEETRAIGRDQRGAGWEGMSFRRPACHTMQENYQRTPFESWRIRVLKQRILHPGDALLPGITANIRPSFASRSLAPAICIAVVCQLRRRRLVSRASRASIENPQQPDMTVDPAARGAK